MRTLILGDPHGGHKAMLQCFERSNFDYDNDELIVLGDVVDGWPQTKECVDELLKIKNLVYIMGNHDCLSSDTECLTRRGWLFHEDITKDDMVFSYNSSTNTGEWVKINKIIKKYFNGYLNTIETNHLSLKCTDNHRILHKKRQSKKTWSDLQYSNFSDLTGRIKIPLSAKTNTDGIVLSLDELKFIAWILTDGYCKQNGTRTNQYQIYQSKKKNIPYITKLLRRLNYEFTLDKRNKKVSEICGKKIKSCQTSYTFRLLNKANKKIEKILPYKYPFYKELFNMNNDQFAIFITELIRGDGSNYNYTDKAWILYGNKDFLNNIQILCILNNMRANITQDTRGAYRLNISDHNSTQLDLSTNKNSERYIGTVWCLSVPNTNFMVRRNGKHFFTGNCWCLQWAKEDEREEMWVTQGGWNTLLSYNFEMPKEHIKFFEDGNLWMEDEEDNTLYVHGGIIPGVPISSHTQQQLLWDRDLIQYAKKIHTREELRARDTGKEFIRPKITTYNEIFIGHTSTASLGGGTKPLHYCNVWNLDTGGGWEGVLTIMDKDTKEYWQSDRVADLYEGSDGRRDVNKYCSDLHKWLEAG